MKKLILATMIGALVVSSLLSTSLQAEAISDGKPFTPHEVRVLVVSPDQLYHSGANLLVADLARYGFNITYHASDISVPGPNYLMDPKTALLRQYDVVILHGIYPYPPSKVSVEEVSHFMNYNGTLVVIGNALFTNETTGVLWENTFSSEPVLKLEQRLGVDFTGHLTTPEWHNNGTFKLVESSIKGLPQSLSYITKYSRSINYQFALALNEARQIYNFTTESNQTTAGVTFYRNSSTGAIGIYIQGSHVYAEEIPVGSRKIRYFGFTDTTARSSLLASLIAFSLGVDIATIIKPQPLAAIRLDGLGESASYSWSETYLIASLANFNSAVDYHNITPTIAFNDFPDLSPEYWQKVASSVLSQLKGKYRDWEYSSSLRNKNLTSMTEAEIEILLQNIRGNYTALEMDLFSTVATSVGFVSQATLDAMISENSYLIDSAGDQTVLAKYYSDWWNLRTASGVVLHSGVRMVGKSIENFTQLGVDKDYLHYNYFSLRDRLALAVINGFPSFVYHVPNFRWDQVGTYSLRTVYENLTSEIPDIRFVPLKEAAMYFGNKWIRIENPERTGSIIEFDVDSSAVPEVVGIAKGMVWLRINSNATISEVLIDDKPWFYFDDNTIRLPANNTHVKIILGDRTTPTVIGTSYKVITTSWSNENFDVTVAATAGLNITAWFLIPEIDPFLGDNWDVFCSEPQEKWNYRFNVSYRALLFWAISDGSVTFQAGYDVVPPMILSVDHSPPWYNSNITVKANITDPKSGVQNAILSYFASSEWNNVTMTLEDGFYVGEIPPFRYGTEVFFKLFVVDNLENWRVSEIFSYMVADNTPPEIGVPEWNPHNPSFGQPVLVRVSVSEPEFASGVRHVGLYYGTDSKTLAFKFVTMNDEDGVWCAAIPGLNVSGKVIFLVVAIDNAGNLKRTENYGYTVLEKPAPSSFLLIAVVSAALGFAIIGTIVYFVKIRRAKESTAETSEKRDDF